MRSRRSPLTLVVVLVLAVLGSALVASPALARGHAKGHKRGTHVSGSIILRLADNVSQPPIQQGAITVTAAEARVTFTGDMRGPAVEPYTSVVMPNNGPTLQFGTGTFTGKVFGRRGTIEYVFSGDAAHGGLITITGGTGRLAGVTGRIAYFPTSDAGADPVVFGYEGRVRLRRH
jgi:hypothetical protein